MDKLYFWKIEATITAFKKNGKVFVMIYLGYLSYNQRAQQQQPSKRWLPSSREAFFVHTSPFFGKNTITYIEGE
jgi:hypothetical protein